MGARMARSWGKIRRLPSGNWQASYLGPDGIRHVGPTTYTAKIDAEGWLTDERRRIERDGIAAWTPPVRSATSTADGVTLATYAKSWLARPGVRDTTREKETQHLRMRVLDPLGDVPLDRLSRAQVAAWWRTLDHDTHPRACDLAYQVLRAMLNSAVDEQVIAANPCKVRGAGGASARRPVTPLTPEQVQACADLMPPGWGVGVLLAAWCSHRSGEVRGLWRSDFHVAGPAPRIEVRRAVVRVGGELRLTDPKTAAGRRTTYVPPQLVPVLAQHLAEVAQPGPRGLILYGRDGGPIHDGSWGRAWRRAANAVGVPASFRFHDLRHTGLTYAAIAGATVRELQEIAGHTSPAAAMRYQEVAAGRLPELATKLGALMR
jgi:integrase